ncbi:hypothetical protein DSL64_04050 [Dyadobacter luteus]|uniref:Uncharacterized protein n=2 Tax=Dyadobacter luteus TaxID=2259619 RepID=A0A3D8YG42_9BACT|nr:hypothetical protein DSL64_04050 [Dyadobacter luteus]
MITGADKVTVHLRNYKRYNLMFTTNPWVVYAYLTGPVIVGYYLFAVFRFYGKEIKAWNRMTADRIRNPSAKSAAVDNYHKDPAETGLIQLRPELGAGEINPAGPQEG